MNRPIAIALACLVGFLLAGCVSSIDDDLPYATLPKITVGTEFTPVASPAHPTSYLPIDPIPAGAQVQLIGVDEDAAWLLVEHGSVLGWMPVFYSRTNLATLPSALVFESPAGKCSKFLHTTLAPDEAWTAGSNRSVIVVGSIFRPKASEKFADALLKLEITGPGSVIASDYVHTLLTADAAVVLFSYTLEDLRPNSELRYLLTDTGKEEVSFQSFFFDNDCEESLTTLPVGQPKLLETDAASDEQRIAESLVTRSASLSATSTPRPTSTPKPTPTPDLNTLAGTVLEIGETWYQGGVSLTLRDHELGPDYIRVQGIFSNLTDATLSLAFTDQNIDVRNNLYQEYRRHGNISLCTKPGFQALPFRGQVSPDSTIDLCREGYKLNFLGDITNDSVREIVITVNFSRIENAKWRIPIYH